MSIKITRDNLYNYYTYTDQEDGFSLEQNEKGDEVFEELNEKMYDEIRLNYRNFNNERSCMWMEEVKRRAKWVRGETIYGFSEENHYTYSIWWSRDKAKIGYYTWVLDADGYVSFSLHNGYTDTNTESSKYLNYIRPSCLYNDKNCDELKIKLI
jgi:hypothetical protein